MSARSSTLRDLARGRLQALHSHYKLSEDTFPECRHCGAVVGWARLRTHLREQHRLDPATPAAEQEAAA